MSARTNQIGDQQKVAIGPSEEGNLFSHKGHKEGELFRVCADGVGFTFTVEWGTSVTRKLTNIQGPLSADFAGGCSITPKNNNVAAAYASVTAAHTTSKGPSVLREFVDATVTAKTAQDGAARIINPGGAPVIYSLPDGTNVTIADVPESTGKPFPIASGSVISAGRAIVEYEI